MDFEPYELKSRQLFNDLSVYVNAYAFVQKDSLPYHIKVLSPWVTYVSDDEDSAVVYSYDEMNSVEMLTLFRLERNDDGSVSNVYSRTAKRDSDDRSLLLEDDTDVIYKIANDDNAGRPM